MNPLAALLLGLLLISLSAAHGAGILIVPGILLFMYWLSNSGHVEIEIGSSCCDDDEDDEDDDDTVTADMVAYRCAEDPDDVLTVKPANRRGRGAIIGIVDDADFSDGNQPYLPYDGTYIKVRPGDELAFLRSVAEHLSRGEGVGDFIVTDRAGLERVDLRKMV
jgi:hypothetical protein